MFVRHLSRVALPAALLSAVAVLAVSAPSSTTGSSAEPGAFELTNARRILPGYFGMHPAQLVGPLTRPTSSQV